MVEIAYNNSNNITIGYTFFELNYSYYPQVFFKDKYNVCSKSFSANKPATRQKKLMNIYL